MDYQKTAEFLKALRKAKGYTQQEVADALYLSPKTISRWESGDGMPDINVIQSVAELYDVSVDEILRGERKQTSPEKASSTEKAKTKRSQKALESSLYKGFRLFEILALAIGGTVFLGGMVVGFCGFGLIGIIIESIGLIVMVILHLISRFLVLPKADEDDEELVAAAKAKVLSRSRSESFVLIMIHMAMAIILVVQSPFFLLWSYDPIDRLVFALLFITSIALSTIIPSLAWRNGKDVKKAVQTAASYAAIPCFIGAIHFGLRWSRDFDPLLNVIGPYSAPSAIGMAVAIVGTILEIAAIALAVWKKWTLPLFAMFFLLYATRYFIEVREPNGTMDHGSLTGIFFPYAITFGLLVILATIMQFINLASKKRKPEDA